MRIAAYVIAPLLIALSAPAAAAQPMRARYMGDISCGAWPRHESYTDIGKAASLNFVLGILFGRSMVSGFDTMSTVDIPSISAWMDKYCENDPLSNIISGAVKLEKEIMERASR